MRTQDSVSMSDGFITNARARSLSDGGTILVEATFDQNRYNSALFASLGVQKPEGLDRMAPKRQADFLAGRFAAALALQEMELPPTPVGMAADRAPIWPQAVSGSISHSDGRAACLVTGDRRFCGVDLEMIASGSALQAILGKCLSESERLMVDHGVHLPPDVAATLLFSAKETIFKAFYAKVGRFFGFDCADARSKWGPTKIPFHLTETLHADLPRGFALEVSYEVTPDHVLTYLCLPI